MPVEAASDEQGWAKLANVGALISKQHPDFGPRSFGYLKITDLAIATGHFDIDHFDIDRRTLADACNNKGKCKNSIALRTAQ